MNKVILYAENEMGQAQPVIDRLEHKGFSVVHCRDTDEALELIEADTKYDLALIDLSLPRKPRTVRGRTLVAVVAGGCQVIRTAKLKDPNKPVWSYSAYGADKFDVSAADRHIQKGDMDIVAAIENYFESRS